MNKYQKNLNGLLVTIAALSTLYLTVLGIIILSLKSIGQF